MLSTTKHARRGAAKGLLAGLAGAVALTAALPAQAQAAPVTIIPGLPPVEIPGYKPPKPRPKPQQKQQPSGPKAPRPPAQPAVASRTGWVGLSDDHLHYVFWYRNGIFDRSMPVSMGNNKHPTPNGTYYVKDRRRSMWMDSSTYGVPVKSPEGYRTFVEYAVRMDWNGIFIHAAPWSVAQQGVSNASHGCLNVSMANGKWVFEHIPRGTPIVVRGTIGGGNWRTPRD
ncbi:MAG: L,D-transpeptidase [Gordonia sp. (in: high G+C Gram-positive bacteria)]|uniref:L,D-transpeptidase n=1 Tax=Gordonia sp. (in: high G+C Gram-positive bacteria) TaxID=84139 RepID=UPI0039E6D9EF